MASTASSISSNGSPPRHFPAARPPQCRYCYNEAQGPQPTGRYNAYGNAGRPYYKCSCRQRGFFVWDDDIGINASNRPCYCEFPSRRGQSHAGLWFFNCSTGACGFWEPDDGEYHREDAPEDKADALAAGTYGRGSYTHVAKTQTKLKTHVPSQSQAPSVNSLFEAQTTQQIITSQVSSQHQSPPSESLARAQVKKEASPPRAPLSNPSLAAQVTQPTSIPRVPPQHKPLVSDSPAGAQKKQVPSRLQAPSSSPPLGAQMTQSTSLFQFPSQPNLPASNSLFGASIFQYPVESKPPASNTAFGAQATLPTSLFQSPAQPPPPPSNSLFGASIFQYPIQSKPPALQSAFGSPGTQPASIFQSSSQPKPPASDSPVGAQVKQETSSTGPAVTPETVTTTVKEQGITASVNSESIPVQQEQESASLGIKQENSSAKPKQEVASNSEEQAQAPVHTDIGGPVAKPAEDSGAITTVTIEHKADMNQESHVVSVKQEVVPLSREPDRAPLRQEQESAPLRREQESTPLHKGQERVPANAPQAHVPADRERDRARVDKDHAAHQANETQDRAPVSQEPNKFPSNEEAIAGQGNTLTQAAREKAIRSSVLDEKQATSEDDRHEIAADEEYKGSTMDTRSDISPLGSACGDARPETRFGPVATAERDTPAVQGQDACIQTKQGSAPGSSRQQPAGIEPAREKARRDLGAAPVKATTQQYNIAINITHDTAPTNTTHESTLAEAARTHSPMEDNPPGAGVGATRQADAAEEAMRDPPSNTKPGGFKAALAKLFSCFGARG